MFCVPSALPLLIRGGVLERAQALCPNASHSLVVPLSEAVATDLASCLPTPWAYLLGLLVLGAGGSGLQTLAGELPCDTHGTCSDVTLWVLEELEGKCGYF